MRVHLHRPSGPSIQRSAKHIHSRRLRKLGIHFPARRPGHRVLWHVSPARRGKRAAHDDDDRREDPDLDVGHVGLQPLLYFAAQDPRRSSGRHIHAQTAGRVDHPRLVTLLFGTAGTRRHGGFHRHLHDAGSFARVPGLCRCGSECEEEEVVVSSAGWAVYTVAAQHKSAHTRGVGATSLGVCMRACVRAACGAQASPPAGSTAARALVQMRLTGSKRAVNSVCRAYSLRLVPAISKCCLLGAGVGNSGDVLSECVRPRSKLRWRWIGARLNTVLSSAERV
jgi:hypothetical protein